MGQIVCGASYQVGVNRCPALKRGALSIRRASSWCNALLGFRTGTYGCIATETGHRDERARGLFVPLIAYRLWPQGRDDQCAPKLQGMGLMTHLGRAVYIFQTKAQDYRA